MSIKKFKKPRNGHKQYNPDTEQYEEQDDRSRKYYNRLLFTKAMKLTNSNPYEAKRLYEEYLDQYPTDCLAWTLYASILITLKEFDLASMILDRAEEMINQYKRKGDDFQEQHADERNLLFGRIRIMSFRGQYKKLLDFLEENPIVEEKYHLDEVKLLCKKKLGICFTQRDDYPYLARQIIKYEVQDMMHRVEYHGADYNAVMDRQENVFAVDFPLQKIIDEIDKYIPSEEHSYCPGVIADCYYFKYDTCGKENQKATNFIKVTCFHNTGDIITVTPVLEGENLNYIDLNYLKEKTTEKPKQMSRIEKFYQRYRKKES